MKFSVIPYPSNNSKPKLRYQAKRSGGRGALPLPAYLTWFNPNALSNFFLTKKEMMGIFKSFCNFSGGIFLNTPNWNFVHRRGTDKNNVG